MLYRAIQTDNKTLMNTTTLLMLIKIWNGRRQEFLPYCNPATMRYVLQNMVNKKFYVSKYDSPLQLLANLFVPTLLKKYAPEIKNKPINLKMIFTQAYSRIRQIFSQQMKVDPQTGKRSATGGIASLYYKAHREGAVSRDVKVHSDEENEATFDQYGSTHHIEEIVNVVSDFIVSNKQESYPEGFLKQLNRLTHVSAKVIDRLAITIHNSDYHELIREALSAILSKMLVKDNSDVCSAQFMLDIKKKIISSKNNKESQKITEILDMFLNKLFKVHGLSYDKYSFVQKIQIRTVLIHILVFNIKKVICHQQLTQQLSFLAKLSTKDVM